MIRKLKTQHLIYVHNACIIETCIHAYKQTIEELEESFMTREQKTQQFESMLEANKNRINDLSDVKQV
jgi:hypothetical protein